MRLIIAIKIHAHVHLRPLMENMAEQVTCVPKELFYEELDKLKKESKSESKLTIFLDDNLYENVKKILDKSNTDVNTEDNIGEVKELKSLIKRKQWQLDKDQIITKDNKIVIPRSQIHKILCQSHSETAHRGRDKTKHFVKERYSEISNGVISLFTSMCRLHVQQQSIVNHLKVVKPIKGEIFLSHVEMDLMDFRKIKCNCELSHQYVLHIIDHNTKFSWVSPLRYKSGAEVLQETKKIFWQFGFPQVLHTDNGKEFRNADMSEFCKVHKIKQRHGAPRKPQTQGLVERNNRTIKENLSNIIKEKKEDPKRWCSFLGEACYKKNITLHRATKNSPYLLVFGIQPQQENPLQNDDDVEEIPDQNNQDQNTDDDGEQVQLELQDIIEEGEGEKEESISEVTQPQAEKQSKQIEDGIQNSKSNKRQSPQHNLRSRKRMCLSVNENQKRYNEEMSSQSKAPNFKVGEIVSVKIDKVDKTSPLHPNLLIGKILAKENTYIKLVTKFGVVTTLISPARLMRCTDTGIKFDTSKEITFTAACKLAMNQ